MKTVIEMAKQAGFDVLLPSEEVFGRGGVYTGSDDEISKYLERFAELLRADERMRAHSLGPGEMELSLRREHNGELYECRRRFSSEEVILGPDYMVEATAYNLEVEMDRAIRARSNT